MSFARNRSTRAVGAALALALVVAVILVWRSASGPEAPAVQGDGTPDPSQPAAVPSGEVAKLLDVVDQAETLRRSAASSALPVASAPGAQAACVVRGQVLDQHDRPVEGGQMWLASSRGPWAEGAETTRRRIRGTEREAWLATTDAEGHFRFEVPLPIRPQSLLQLEPSIYHATVHREFGAGGPAGRAKLAPGDNDLGILRVAVTGALRGRVQTPDGRPVSGATFSARRLGERSELPRDVSTAALGTEQSDAQGEFLVGHVLPGEVQLTVKADGMLTTTTPTVQVVARRTLELGVIVVAEAPTLRGLVVDDRGEPAAWLGVEARSTFSRKLVRTRTDEAGHFLLTCADNAVHVIEIDGERRYKSWGGESDPHAQFTPDGVPARIVMVRLTKTTFIVRAAGTLEPIEHFGIEVWKLPSSEASRAGPTWDLNQGRHPDGSVDLPAEPGVHGFTIAAAGFAPAEGQVAHDAIGSPVQTVVLEHESVLTARLVLNGVPIRGAQVALAREPLDRHGQPIAWLGGPGQSYDAMIPETAPDGSRRLVPKFHFDVGLYSGRRQRLTTREDGAIRFEQLEGGRYHLLVEVPDFVRLAVRDVTLPEGGLRDLADIEVPKGAAITGQLVLPVGHSRGDYVIHLQGVHSYSTSLDELQRFQFSALAPGSYRLGWRRGRMQTVHSEHLGEQWLDLVLAPGETREVLLDAASTAPCTVAVRILRNHQPAGGVIVRLKLEKAGQADTMSLMLGTTDSEGWVERLIEGGARATPLVVLANRNEFIPGDAEAFLCPVGGRVERTFELCAGTLALELPAGLEPPRRGLLSLSYTASPGKMAPMNVFTPEVDKGLIRWTGRTVELGELGCGRYEATLSVRDLDRDASAREFKLQFEVRADERSLVAVD